MSHLAHPAPVTPFAGRIGGNQEFIVDRNDPHNADLLEQIPDAAPSIPFKQILDLRGFRQYQLWQAAAVEGIASFLITFSTGWIGISPDVPPPSPDPRLGFFNTSTFLGPLIGGVTSAVIVTVLIYCFSPVSGGHINPFITMSTLFARLTTLPRAVLYIAFQLLGSTLAGLLLRASYNSRAFKVGGCFLFPEIYPVHSALALEYTSCLVLIFLAFGVGLDPRQREIFGPALAPMLVGLSLGTLSFGMAWGVPGFGGASMNPARCFGVSVGSSWKGYEWYYWVAALAASLTHGILYALLPPWGSGLNAEKAQEKRDRNPRIGQVEEGVGGSEK